MTKSRPLATRATGRSGKNKMLYYIGIESSDQQADFPTVLAQFKTAAQADLQTLNAVFEPTTSKTAVALGFPNMVSETAFRGLINSGKYPMIREQMIPPPILF